MKRFLSVVAIILLTSACLTSCEQSQKQSTPPVTKAAVTTSNPEVALSASNIGKYLNISGQYGETKSKKLLGQIDMKESDFTINIYPTVPGNFCNVTITLKVDLTSGWRVDSFDSAYIEGDGECLTTTIKLPTYGSIEEVHSVYTLYSYHSHDKNPKIQVVSVSGTFVPAK